MPTKEKIVELGKGDCSRLSDQGNNQVMKLRFGAFENAYVEVLRWEWMACSCDHQKGFCFV